MPECGFTPPNDGLSFRKWDKGAPGDKVTVSGNLLLTAQWMILDPQIRINASDVDVVYGDGSELPDLIEPDRESIDCRIEYTEKKFIETNLSERTVTFKAPFTDTVSFEKLGMK